MKKTALCISFALIASTLAGCGNNNSSSSGTIDKSDKNTFLSCKQKVDIVKDSLSELTMEESGEYRDDTSKNRLMKKEETNRYNELSKEKYLTLQNFGLYILNNVYYSVTYGYESESVSLNQMIYDEVQNELNGNYRNYLKQSNKTNKFYMLIEKTEENYSFSVDWLGDGQFRGDIYVAGNISISGNDVKNFTVTSFTEDKSCYIFAAHYDFVSNDFYQFNTSHDDADYLSDTNALIEKLNNNQLTTDDLEASEFDNISVATGKITKNISEINYHGYLRDEGEDTTNKTAFNNVFNALKDKISLAKVRTSANGLDYSQSKRVSYMDAALQYGLDTTRLFITSAGSAVFAFVNKETFAKTCDNVPNSYKETFLKAKNKVASDSNKSLSLEYNDEEIEISEMHANEQYYSLNTYYVDSIHYSLVDKIKDETLYFSIKGEKIVNIRSTNMDYVPEDDPNYEVTIKFMTGFGRDANSQLENGVIASFNAQYSGKYKIQLESAGGGTQGVIETIKARAAIGNVEGIPEIMITKSDALETLVKNDVTRKYLYNFDSFFENSGVGFSSDEFVQFDQQLLNDGINYSVEGRWSLPFDTSDQYMFYDKTLFEGKTKQFDLPTTFEELISVARQIKDSVNNQDYIPVAFTDTKNILMDVFIQNDIPVLTNRDNPFEFTNNEYRTKSLEILDTFKSCVDERLFSSKDMTSTYVNELFNNGRCAIGFMQSDAIKYINNKDNLGVAKVPFDSDNQTYVRAGYVSSISLLKTGNPYATKGAWLFIKKMLSEFSVDYSLLNNFTPSLKYEMSDVQLTGISHDVASIHNEIRDNYVNVIKVENIDSIYNELDNVFSGFAYRGLSSEQVIDNLLSLANQ